MARPLLLIHGGCHGAWCWDGVVAHIAAAGGRALAIDLPGHGGKARASLADGIAATVEALGHFDQPAILVGHSLGGMTISGAAEAMPEGIARLVYLAALLPVDGESAATIPHPVPLGAEAAALLVQDGSATALDIAVAPAIFYHDCAPSMVEAALARVGTTDVGYIVETATLSIERFGSVPKSYITCLRDRAIQPEAQHAMIARYPDIDRRALDTGHSPFLAAPAALAALLLDLARG